MLTLLPRGQIWALALMGCIVLLPLLMGPIIVGVLVDYGGFSDRAAGFTAGFGAIGSVLIALICALTIHRLPLRRLALIGISAAALTNGASALMYEQHELFYLLRVINSFGDGAGYAAVMSTFAREQNSERCYGLFMMLQFGLAGIGLWALPTYLPEMTVTQMYLGMAGLNLFALGLATSLPTTAALAEGISIRASEWRLLASVTAFAGLVALCFFEASNTATDAFVERIAVHAGLSDAEIGSSLGIASLMGVPGAFAILWVGSRFGHARPVLIGVAIGAVSLYLLLQAESHGAFVLWTSIHSITWAFTTPYIQSILADMDPGGAVVTAGGIASGAGGGLGPSAAALLVTADNYGGVLIVGLATYAIAAVGIVIAGRGLAASAEAAAPEAS
ncbi:MAG: MFS transporter [Pseudomonadota bacterium]